MSKQAVVTDSMGTKTTYEGVAEVYVEGGALWLSDTDGKNIAVIRSWERAERVEDAPLTEPKPSPEEVIRAWNGRPLSGASIRCTCWGCDR